jgi:hypothetical protein
MAVVTPAASAAPRDTLGPGQAAGADVGAHHGEPRAAEAEDERDLQILEPRAHPVPGQRRRPERPHEAREQHDREIGLDGVERAGRADAQDVREERPAQPDPAQLEAHQAAAR